MARNVDTLRVLLRRRVESASKEALKTEGQVSSRELQEIERLERLIEVADVSQPATRKRWLLAAALGGTLVVVSVLFFVRVRETEIELDLAVRETGFVLDTQQVLTEVINLTELVASGLEAVHLPQRADGDGPAPGAGEMPVSAVYVATGSNGEQRGTVSLAALPLSASTRVSIQHTEVPHLYRLSLEGDSLALRVDVRGPVRIGLAGETPTQRDYLSPRPLLMQGAPGIVDMDLTLEDVARATFASQFRASNLSFSRIDQFEGEERTLVRRVSTILTGTLYLEALDGRPYSLRPGEALHFDRVEGLIRTLQLREDGIALKFRGRARGMRTGWGPVQRSLMPTYLEWLKARHGLYLLWGTTLYVFGLIASLLRWWGVRL